MTWGRAARFLLILYPEHESKRGGSPAAGDEEALA